MENCADLDYRPRMTSAAGKLAPSPALTPLVLGCLASTWLIWGSTYLGIHIAIQSIPPLLMAGGRFLLAGGILYAVVRLRGVARPSAVQWGNAAVIGTLLLLGGNWGGELGAADRPLGNCRADRRRHAAWDEPDRLAPPGREAPAFLDLPRCA